MQVRMAANQTDLEAAYDLCQRITKTEAKNFYYAFRTLPPVKRRAIYAAYAFCRLCDDLSDGDLPHEERVDGFRLARAALSQARRGRFDTLVMAALADAVGRFGIPWEYFEEIIDGVEMDLEIKRYETFVDLQEYCYKVASVVGLVSIEIFGYHDAPHIREYAVDLGTAMQLTNILRDLKEDVARGRIYIPQDEMRRFRYSEDELMRGVVNENFRELMTLQVRRGRKQFESGKNLVPFLSRDSRACAAVLIAVYGSILGRIEAANYDVFSQRIGLSAGQKMAMTARLWAMSRAPGLQRWL